MQAITVFWINIIVFVIMFAVIVIKVFFTLLYFKKETIAIIVSEDKRTKKFLQINPSEESFVLDKKTYAIGESFIRYKNKRLIFYKENNPIPLNIMDYSVKTIDGKTLHQMMQNEVIRAVNKVRNGMFDNIDIKKVIMIIGAVLLGIYLMKNGGF